MGGGKKNRILTVIVVSLMYFLGVLAFAFFAGFCVSPLEAHQLFFAGAAAEIPPQGGL